MSIFKRGRVYWYHFIFNGVHVQQSTKQGNPRVARQFEAAHRTSLAKGEVGFREKRISPSLGEFIVNRFEPWARGQFETSSPKTWRDWYRCNLRAIAAFPELCSKRIDSITSEDIASFGAHRQSQGLQVSSVNCCLRVLRRVFTKASEWGALSSPAPKVELLRGERHRERVLSSIEESRYLAACPEPLHTVATLLADTGMRPEECYRLRWEGITWTAGGKGSLQVTHGKTPAARRFLPMTARVRQVVEALHVAQGSRTEGWIFPAKTKSGHIEPSTIKKRHASVFRILAEEPRTSKLSTLQPFVLYTFRHTFATRLGESGIDAWTMCRVMGWGNVGMSHRYVHPSTETVFRALERLDAEQRPARPMLEH